MTAVKPFRAVRPKPSLAGEVAALPYDVYSRKEARKAVEGSPRSFLNIDRPETQFPENVDMYGEAVYKKAGQMLAQWISQGIFEEEETACYYIYELEWKGQIQTGVVGCSSVEDYEKGVIRRHENTREEKEQDRIRHIKACGAQTGPIFLTYRDSTSIDRIVKQVQKEGPLYHFISEDGIRHTVWRIADPALTEQLETAFGQVPCTYIADGHHRAASAVKVGLEKRKEGCRKEDPSQYFLSVLFPAGQLRILPYNRLVKDLNGLSEEKFLSRVKENFSVEPVKGPWEPSQKGRFGMYVKSGWYEICPKVMTLQEDPVAHLDVSVLQNYLLEPILGIQNPRLDKRIEFVGGIRGTGELVRRVDTDMAVAFSMYPTSMEELLAVADCGLLMPPKSTWFEPKLRSGLFLHRI